MPPLDIAQATGKVVGSATSPGGAHMEDWAKGPAPWLNAIKYGAGVGTSVAGAATTAAGPWGTVAGTGLNMVLGTIADGVDAYDSQRTVAELKRIGARELPKVKNEYDRDQLIYVLDVAITKKTRHRDIAISQAATLQISKIGTAAYRTVRAIHKWRTGTKGESRGLAADILVDYLEKAEGPACDVAKAIVRILCKKNFDDLLKSSIKESLRS